MREPKISLRNFSVFLFLCFSISLFLSFLVRAQSEPYFWVTWKSNNFVPSFYEGKSVPVRDAIVDVRLELIDGGRSVDLSQYTIRWFLDREKISEAVGKKNFRIRVTNSDGFPHDIKIQIVDYGGTTLERIFRLPVVKPQLTLDVPYPNNNIKAGEINVRAWPYFWKISDIKDLLWSWTVAGQKPTGVPAKPNRLELTIPAELAGGKIDLEVGARNPGNRFETWSENATLNVR